MSSIRSSLCLVCFMTGLLLSSAPGQDPEWARWQAEYNEAATRSETPAIAEGVRETKGAIGPERCTSCHLVEGGEPAIADHSFFAPHPDVAHDPQTLGCVGCHGGDPKALDAESAHGGPPPFLPRASFEAGCGSCHTSLSVVPTDRVTQGHELIEQYGCLECHRLGDQGDPDIGVGTRRDLGSLGVRGVPAGWSEGHVVRRLTRIERHLGRGYRKPEPEEIEIISDTLRTLAGAPRLAEGKLLFHDLGCRGCHQVQGVGGDDGPDFSHMGLRDVTFYPTPEGFDGDVTVHRWLVGFLTDPDRLRPAMKAPHPRLTTEQADRVALYLESIRPLPASMEWWPPDRLRVERLHEREFSTDGASLYGVFCQGCHGDGKNLPEFFQGYPSLLNLDFLAVASDDFLHHTITTGRRGRRMPAWSQDQGGLRPTEIHALVRYLRSREPSPPGFEEVMAARVEPTQGAKIYEKECRACHGARSEGGIAPSHHSPAFRALVSDRFLYETLVEGRPGTSMPSFRELNAQELRSLIAHMRTLARSPAPDLDLITVQVPLGDARQGRQVYESSCRSCHGKEGEGGSGPAIGNWAFLRAAGPAFVVESYLRKRCQDDEGSSPPSVGPGRLADVVAYLESRAARPGLRLGGPRVQGNRERGEKRYRAICGRCHGPDGESDLAPSLSNPDFLAAANDAYLQATILRGHRNTGMPRFDQEVLGLLELTPQEINDIVAFIRSWDRRGR